MTTKPQRTLVQKDVADHINQAAALKILSPSKLSLIFAWEYRLYL